MKDRCRISIDRIAALLDGILPERERRELEEHLVACARCRAELALQKGIREALAARPAPVLSGDFTETVMGRLRTLPARRRRRLRAALLRSAAAAGLLAVSLTPLLAGGGGGDAALSGAGDAAGNAVAALAAPLHWIFHGASRSLSGMIPAGPVPFLAILLVGAAGVWGTRIFLAYLRD